MGDMGFKLHFWEHFYHFEVNLGFERLSFVVKGTIRTVKGKPKV